MSQSQDRHISPETLEDYVAKAVPATLPIVGSPAGFLTIDSPNETLRLELEWDGQAAPQIGDYLHISTGTHHRGGQNWSTLEIHGKQYFTEAYPLLRSVADLVQQQDLLFADALRKSLESYHNLLTSIAPMSETDELGLFGELFVVSLLIDETGPGDALLAWRGGDEFEEHDLGLPEGDVEIKTTSSEHRRHWIGSLTQLVPSNERPLWLLSVQVTGAGAGQALRLPDLIDSILEKLPAEHQSTFQARLAGTAFRTSQPRERFRLLALRSAPALFLVDDEFPKIDPTILEHGGARLSNLAEVSYTISLDGIAPETTWPPGLGALGVGDAGS